MEATLPFFQWMGATPMAQYFQNTTWSTPIVQVIHLVAIASFVGSVLIVDMRLLGAGLTETPLRDLARSAEPWVIGSFVVLFITGLPQLTSTALKQYYSPFFWWKMEAMLLALILMVTVRRKMTRKDEADLGPFWPKVVGLTSIALWTAVIIGARLIGLLS